MNKTVKKVIVSLMVVISMSSIISCGNNSEKKETTNSSVLEDKQDALQSEYILNINDMLKDKGEGVSTLRTSTYNTATSGDKYSIRDIIVKGKIADIEDSGEYLYVYLGESLENAVVCKFNNSSVSDKKNNLYTKGDTLIVRGILSNKEDYKLEDCIKIDEKNFDSEIAKYKLKLEDMKKLSNSKEVFKLTNLVENFTQDKKGFMDKYEGQQITISGITVDHQKNGFILYLIPTEDFVIKDDNGIVDTSNCVACIWDMKSTDIAKLDALQQKQNVTIKGIITESQTIKKVYFSLTECILLDDSSVKAETVPADINPNGENR